MTSDARDIRTWDGVVLFWVVMWVIIGCAVGITIWGLSGLSVSAVQSGRALDNAGQALEGLGKIPVIGDGPSEFGAQVRETAKGIIINGEQGGDRIQALAVLLGVTIAIVPSVPVGGFYVPFRLRRRRDIQQVREALNSDGLSDDLREYLARRALVSLTFPQVNQAIGPHGSLDSVEGVKQLALAELRRLGIRPVKHAPSVDE